MKADDTLDSVRDALAAQINANPEEAVVAVPVGAYHRMQLRAKVPGPAGEGITYSATSAEGDNTTSLPHHERGQPRAVLLQREGLPRHSAGTRRSPAETLYVFATGFGAVLPDAAQQVLANTGERYTGPVINNPRWPVDQHSGQRFDGERNLGGPGTGRSRTVSRGVRAVSRYAGWH